MTLWRSWHVPEAALAAAGSRSHDGCELAESRGGVLWRLDRESTLRFSHENPEIQALYRDYLGKPLGERAHHLLHTDHNGWKMPLSPRLKKQEE